MVEEGAALPVGAEVEVGLFAATPFEKRGKEAWPFATPLVFGAGAGEGAGAAAKDEAVGSPGSGVGADGLGARSGWTPFVLVEGAG